ncbi:hypothetical protein ATI61_103100 [Archangium gephyra]|uniref:Uncharacterized protein n=1 Tax=Archangium gephyra TaxID=48 RepID=A0AAC8Q5J3_9BACT|nr:hypothetical protein [Archangium gephyra]AKJ01391.1 Hypothetical protein AA314_03017 [Archangium gephyra]REG34207.1 hypothetical protein ATI61_103100 [Archangium gephyra]
MNSFRSILTAPLRAFSELKLLGVLLAANLCIALIQSLPVLMPAIGRFGHSLSGQGRPFPSPEAVFDFSKLLAQGGGPFLAGPVVLGIVFSFGLQLVLAGGIVSRLCSPGRFSLASFARDCAAQLGRNLRLLGWALLGLLPVVGLVVLATVLFSRAEKPTLFTLEGQHWALDNPFTFWSLTHLALVVVLFALWRSSFDLARVQLYAEDQRKTRLAAWRALKRMVRSPGALLGYIAVGLLGLAMVMVFARLHAAVQVTSAGKAWLALLVAQLVVIARLGFSLATTAFTVDVYRAMAAPVSLPAPVPAAAPILAPASEANAAEPTHAPADMQTVQPEQRAIGDDAGRS